jgi:hypothetical protein
MTGGRNVYAIIHVFYSVLPSTLEFLCVLAIYLPSILTIVFSRCFLRVLAVYIK